MLLPLLDPIRPAQRAARPAAQLLATRSPTGEAPRQAGDDGPAHLPVAMLRILVVDDNRDAAECFSLLLQLGGHISRVAHTGEQALAIAGSFRPDVAFLDIGLPGMDGYQVAQALRRSLGTTVLLVALTGWDGAEVRQRALAHGFDLHLTKPADPQAVDQLLARHGRLGARGLGGVTP